MGEALEAPFILTFQGINVPQQNTIYYLGNDLRRGAELPTLTPCSPPPWLCLSYELLVGVSKRQAP